MKSVILLLATFLLFNSCSNDKINNQSYKLGSVASFSEMINAGVKKLALSSTMTSAEMDKFMPLAQKVALKHNVSIYRENDLITTALFP